MASIFLSYRRADSAAMTGRIYDRLVARFGRQAVFKDVDNIPAGTDFPTTIQHALNQGTVTVVIIGARWMEVQDAAGHRRIDDPEDHVRVETETALANSKSVIPVLVDEAPVPTARDLPESLAGLSRIQMLSVRYDPDFERDMERVIAAIERTLGAATAETTQPVPTQTDPLTATTTGTATKPTAGMRIPISIGLIAVGILLLVVAAVEHLILRVLILPHLALYLGTAAALAAGAGTYGLLTSKPKPSPGQPADLSPDLPTEP